ncbi:MAG: pilus assembly protein PilM [Dehalococcoidales bacterium]|nr:pilus assembly protein PilM [Dehalococcoidales bacterium]MDD4230770.1 pilus assembly protein PilM [Dehalococcoidales bacterium]MDD5402606.1 pilus assembly protein PilM [Dehalococcoidales bacterium]
MAKKKVTLYIEDTEIKLLTSNGHKINKWASFSLEPSLVHDGAIQDEVKVAQAIKELFRLQKVSTKKVTVALSGLNSIFRVISLPVLPPKMLPEAIINEASRVIPRPLEEVYLSHQVISSLQGETRIFLTAYPRTLTDTLMRTLSKAGLKTTVMDLAPLALARCVNEPRAVLVHAWLSNLDIVILADRLPQVVRSISLSGEEMTVEEKSSAIAEELNRTVSFYNSNRKSSPLDNTVPVYVSGDLVQEELLWQSFTLELADYTISPISPPVEAPEVFSPSQYMVNIGLALKGALPGKADSNHSIIDMNILPEAYLPPSFSWYRILVPVAAVCAIGGLFYIWLMIQDVGNDITKIEGETSAVNARANQIRSEISPIRTAIAEQKDLNAPLTGQIDTLEKEIDSTQQLASVFNQTADTFLQDLANINADIPELFTLKPDGVTLSSVTADGSAFNLEGSANTENDIYEYARALRSSERFSMVNVNGISERENEDGVLYTFNIVVQ